MDIRFNYARPRYYEAEDRWILPKGGDKMEVKTLRDIATPYKGEKTANVWLQMFDCGCRVTTENIDWKSWNGCVYSDIDSKHYYNECRKFDADVLKNGLHDYLLINYNLNYLGMQTSNSGTGYHILFYFDVEKSEENFKKCAQRVKEIVSEAFANIGAKEIFEWPKVADRCSASPYQGMYLTDKPWLWGNSDQPGFGSFEDIETYELEKERVKVSDVQPDGSELFKLKTVKLVDIIGYKDHHQRWAIYDALIAVFKDKDKIDAEWAKIANILPEKNNHTHDFYLDEPRRNRWFERYRTGDYVKVSRLEEFGYRFKKVFVPKELDLYNADLVYELEDDQHLTDIDIDWDKNRCNHVFAGCGFGKTFMAKEFTNSGKRTCFISPMTSINKDSFDKEDAKHWLIVDANHTDEVEHVCGNVQNALASRWSICTTWESFWLYEMWKYDFEYFVVDEIHTLYMYDYRLESIAHIKDALNRIEGIRILMTGTPSYEVEEFDCKKIQVNKRAKKVKADIVFYYDCEKGYVYNDMRDWINESPDNIVLLFRDGTNYQTEEDLKFYGIECDVFNKQYTETVNFVLNNQTVRKQVTVFSVYGQAGINLYIDTEKKARVYIMNDSSLGIIQYANRVRNKEVIDKVVIPYKYSKLNNNIKDLDTNIDYEFARTKVDMINSNSVRYDFFDDRYKKLFEVRYGMIPEVLDKLDDKYALNERRYKAYKLVKNVQKYESQMQLIYNRLSTNYFDVSYIYPDADVPLAKHSQLRQDRFSGQMVRFDWNMVQETRDGVLWVKPTEEFNKVVTGDLKAVIEDIINRIYKQNDKNKEKTEAEFKSIVQEFVRRTGGITKADIVQYDEFLVLIDNYGQYIDVEFLENMTKDDWNPFKDAARYTRSLYNETIDWKNAAREVYGNLKRLSRIVYNYLDVFMFQQKVTDKMEIPDDEITRMIEEYLRKTYIREKKKGGPVIVDGVRYGSIKEAMHKTGLSRSTIWRKMKQSAQVEAGGGAGKDETISTN